MDLKKEIKLSDLFRRNKGPEVEETAEKKPRKSLSLRRGAKEPRPPKEARAPKEPRERKPKEKKRKEQPVAASAAPVRAVVPLMRAIDLLPKDDGREGKSKAGLPRIALALFGLIVIVGLAGGFMLMSARVGDRRAQADDLRAQLAELTASAPAPAGQTGASLAGEEPARTTALSEALASRIAWDRILREFTLVLPDDVNLTSVTLGTTVDAATPGAVASGTFSVFGFASSQASVALLLSRLSVIPEFASVTLESSARAVADPESVDPGGPTGFVFAIVAALADGAEVEEATP